MRAFKVFGTLVVLVGFVLLIGNVTGLLRSFPFAGFLGITIGGLISRLGGSDTAGA